MTEKQTNRFADFTFGFLDDREVRWKETKNGFHHHGQIYSYMVLEQNKLLNQQTTFWLTRLYMAFNIFKYNIVDFF